MLSTGVVLFTTTGQCKNSRVILKDDGGAESVHTETFSGTKSRGRQAEREDLEQLTSEFINECSHGYELQAAHA
jgi:hypothetical protein